MKVNNEIIRGVLQGMLSDSEAIIHRGKHYQLGDIVTRIVVGLNDLDARTRRITSLKADQKRLSLEHAKATGEIDDEIIGIQDECPHFSFSEEPRTGIAGLVRVVVCDTCSRLLEKEIIGNGG